MVLLTLTLDAVLVVVVLTLDDVAEEVEVLAADAVLVLLLTLTLDDVVEEVDVVDVVVDMIRLKDL